MGKGLGVYVESSGLDLGRSRGRFREFEACYSEMLGASISSTKDNRVGIRKNTNDYEGEKGRNSQKH